MKAFTRRLMMGTGLASVGSLFMARIAGGAQRRADLTVTALRWSNDGGIIFHTDPVIEGDGVIFQADVRNQGRAAWPMGKVIAVGFREDTNDGPPISWSDDYFGGLYVNQSVTLTANGGPDGDPFWNSAPAGAFTVYAHVDRQNVITESNDNNNVKTAIIVVEPGEALPDLIISAVRWSHDDGQTWHTGPVPAGAHVWFEADIQNQGDAATPAGVLMGVDFLVDDVEVAWAAGYSQSLAAGETVSLRANGGPDGDRLWNGAPPGDHLVGVRVDDALRIDESDETNNAFEAQITVQGTPRQAPAGAIGALSGGGNILFKDSANVAYKVPDLQRLHCGMARVRSDASVGYYAGSSPSPQNHDQDVLLLLEHGVRPYFSFFASDNTVASLKNYDVWFAIGQAFATRFRPGSDFLRGQGFDSGAYGYSAANEPDHARGETALKYAEYRAILEGLADGVKSVQPGAKVFPGGYLSANRDQEYTGWGYGKAIAPLVNSGQLDGIDLHTYHSRNGAKIHDTYDRSHQSDMDRFLQRSGINNRSDLLLITTETNIRNADLSGQDYASLYPGSGLTNKQVARNWMLTSMFDVWGCVRPDGSLAWGGPRFPWQLWRQGVDDWYMAANTASPVLRDHTGHTYWMLMDLLWDMRFTFADPKRTGVFKLKGGGKSAWVFQNIHPSWSSRYGSSFTIDDIPAGTTKVDVYDGNGRIETVNHPNKPKQTFSTPVGKSYLFIADA